MWDIIDGFEVRPYIITIPAGMKSNRGKGAGKARKADLRAAILPAAILLAALVWRTVSLNSFPPLPDEKITRDVVAGIWDGQWSNNWKYTVTDRAFRVDLYNFSSYLYADAVLAGVPATLGSSLPDGHPDLISWSRLVSALAGTLAVFWFYLVARRLFNRATGLVAMTLMAAMPLLVQDAHYARPEAFVLALTAVAYLLLARFDAGHGTWAWVAGAGFCFGLLIACKISLVPMALVPVPFLARIKDRASAGRTAGICAAAVILGFMVGVPDAVFHPAAFWHGVDFLRNQYAGAFRPHASIDSNNSVGLTAAYFWQTTGLLLLFSAAGAFVLARARRFALLAAIGGPVAFYLLYFCFERTFFERNLSHVAPLMAMLAAVALVAAGERFPEKRRSAVLIALVALAGGREAWVSGKLVFEAMRGTPERRAFRYEIALQQTLGHRLDGSISLFMDSQLDTMIQTAAAGRDMLVRVPDYHDSFTKKHLEELQKRTAWRQAGYFPSVFEDFDVSTLIAYHGVSLRYLLLRAPRP
ncbi:MAG TPA: glycosyltransferase family 39 protein [Bryobacteraceae bacterium]|nr:glycosyltransferase family 39 protein [Bryobacteraceae bacterium]